MPRLLTALALVLIFAAPGAAQRLPNTVVPSHYTLWFAPDLKANTFRGRETIDVRINTPTRAITLNAAEIKFTAVTVTAAGRMQRAQVTTDGKRETATFTVPQQLVAGPATMQIEFTGILNDKLRGFYISEANNRKYAVTQMEATDARRAFPCWDEPAYKATFDISLLIDKGDVAISNGRQISDTPGPEAGKHTVTFARSPKMSTYLVAMLVGDFVCRTGGVDGILVRVCSTPDKRGETAFALEATEAVVKFYDGYFGVKYPFGKLDIIGVPDFAAGAMENAGAITFREVELLADPQRASLGAKKEIAYVVAHEIAHQWFGDLVTMKWWNDVWLNEGFATWMGNKAVRVWQPNWHRELDEETDTLTALSLDALRTTRPIRTNAETPEEINELFDPIAYEKTAAVLRMIEAYIGPDSFQKGVASYIRKYSYSNAAGEDFWDEMTRVTGKPVDRIMKSFVDQPGAPVLDVMTRCLNPGADITITQDRFVGAPGAKPTAPQTWVLPACFKTTTGQPRCDVIDRRQHTAKADSCTNVFANAQGRGYYLSDYSPDAVRALAKDIEGLLPVERYSLVGDEWWMVRSGRHDVDTILDLAAALATDPTPAIAESLAGRMAFVADYLTTGANRGRFEAWLRGRFGPALASIGLPGTKTDSEDVQSRRASLLTLLGVTANDAAVQQQARDLAEKYISDANTLPPTLAGTALSVAAIGGNSALYEKYLGKLDMLKNQPQEYYRYFYALADFHDPALIRRTLDFALSPAVRSQDTGSLIGTMLVHPASSAAAWEFTKKNWDALVKKLGVFQGIPSIIQSLGGTCSAQAASDMRQFFMQHPVPSSARTLQQALERIDNCVAVKQRQSPPLAKWLAAAR